MGNYFEKVITILTITQYIPKWFNLIKQQKIYKNQISRK